MHGLTNFSIPRVTGSWSKGQTLVLFALFIVVFIGVAALTVDIGSLLVARRDYQATTDSAALAGTSFLTDPGAQSCADAGTAKEICARRAAWGNLNSKLGLGLTQAQIDVKGNGNVAAAGQTVGQYTVWVDTPPGAAGAAYPGTRGSSPMAVFTRVNRLQPTFFGRIFGYTGFNVSAWSTTDTYPGRLAIITLRRGAGSSQIDDGSPNAQDIKIAGNTSTLTVIGGDIGGNWGMKVTSGNLKMVRPSAVYVREWVSCGPSCWPIANVTDETGTPLASTYPPSGAKYLPRFVEDPNYVAPTGLNTNAPNGPTSGIPVGDFLGRLASGPGGSFPITRGSVSGATCAAGSPRIGPGTYSRIDVNAGNCLVLDPTFRYSNATSNPNVAATATPVPVTQQPGVFYFTGKLILGNGALIVGDGVTIVFRPDDSDNSQFSPNGILDLNTGKANAGTALKLGGWTTKGRSPYAWDTTLSPAQWVYQSSQETDIPAFGRGIAMYVLKPSQYRVPAPALDAFTGVVKVTSGAAFSWNGVTYAPHDEVQLAGQPGHQGIGQLVAWDFTFNGGADVTQTYDGPGEGTPYLVEPCTSANGGAC